MNNCDYKSENKDEIKMASILKQTRSKYIKGAYKVSKQEHISTMHNIEHTCTIQWYNIAALKLMILSIIIFIVINVRKLKL